VAGVCYKLSVGGGDEFPYAQIDTNHSTRASERFRPVDLKDDARKPARSFSPKDARLHCALHLPAVRLELHVTDTQEADAVGPGFVFPASLIAVLDRLEATAALEPGVARCRTSLAPLVEGSESPVDSREGATGRHSAELEDGVVEPREFLELFVAAYRPPLPAPRSPSLL